MKVFRIISFIIVTFIVMGSSCKDKNLETIENPSNDESGTTSKDFIFPLAGTDELGRVLPNNEDVGNPRNDRQVGIFYFLWQGDPASKTSEKYWDLSKIIPQHPEVLEDGDNEFWGTTSRGSYYFWGESIFGYYSGDDYWVHLRNMQLLTDAGIDFLVLDATNAIFYERQSHALMKAIKALQDQGRKAPKLVYYTNTESGKTMQQIYNTYYKVGALIRYPSTWYVFEGKPLIIGRTNEAKGKDFETFFTYREAQWPNEPDQQNGWPWIDFKRPQMVYENHKGEREIINVSVCQHPNPSAGMGGSAFYGNMDNWGRSYRNGSHGNPETDIFYGYNFQEQWDYALKQNVPFIFITGWNEWVAGRWGSQDNNKEHSYFCDQANPEYSRDIEPTLTSGLKDNYYMQMVTNIRKYKGVNPVPKARISKAITNFDDWKQITPVYTDYIGDTQHRNHPAAISNPPMTYINNTGRNDFEILKVARDKENIYFYAQTVANISEQTGNNWMSLYINSDRDHDTGWYGYDYRISGKNQLEKFEEGKWLTIKVVSLEFKNNMLVYNLPIKSIFNDAQALDFEFKWSDNMQNEDPMDWYINGDTAPEGRFNYVYISE